MKYQNLISSFSLQQRAKSNLIANGALFFVIGLLLFLPIISSAQTDPNAPKVGKEDVASDDKTKEIPAKSTLRGKVVYDDTGSPVRRARIYLFSSSSKSSGQMNALTDNNGAFEIKNVQQGTYFVMVNSPGIITPFGLADNIETLDKYPEKEFFDRVKELFEEFSVDGTSDTKVEVRAKRGGAISGKVTYANGDPAVSVRVNILRKKEKNLSRVMTGFNTSIFNGVATDDRGIYRVAGLPPGEYLISVAEPAMHNGKSMSQGDFDGMFDAMGIASLGSLLVTYYPDVTSPESATPINVSLGQEQENINITVADRGLYKISGKVVSRSDKNPVSGATVRLKKNDRKIKDSLGIEKELNEVRTDEQGNWSFLELPDGIYTISVESISESEPKYNDKGEYEGTIPKRQLAGKKQEVNVSGSDVTDIFFELSDGGSIEGTVKLASGKPLQTSPIYVRAESVAGNQTDEDSDNRYGRSSDSGYVEGNGKFEIRSLSAGPVYLSVDWYDKESQKYYVKSITLNGMDLTNSTLNLTEGGKVKNVQVVLGDDAATLKGKVSLADNKPAFGVGIVLISTDATKWKRRSSKPNDSYTMTDTQGEFSITTAPGEYFIVFLRAGDNVRNMSESWIRERTANAQRVLLNPNDNKAITLTAPQ